MLLIFASFMEITDWYSFSSMVWYAIRLIKSYRTTYSYFPHSYIIPSFASIFISLFFLILILIFFLQSYPTLLQLSWFFVVCLRSLEKSCIYIHLIFLYINLVLVTAVFFHCLPSFHSNLLPTNIFVAIRTVCYLATYTIQFHMYIVPLIKVLYHCTVWSNIAIAIRTGGHYVVV